MSPPGASKKKKKSKTSDSSDGKKHGSRPKRKKKGRSRPQKIGNILENQQEFTIVQSVEANFSAAGTLEDGKDYQQMGIDELHDLMVGEKDTYTIPSGKTEFSDDEDIAGDSANGTTSERQARGNNDEESDEEENSEDEEVDNNPPQVSPAGTNSRASSDGRKKRRTQNRQPELETIVEFSRSQSVENRATKCRKHFDLFLAEFMWEDFPNGFSDIKGEDVNTDLMGKFGTYLAKFALNQNVIKKKKVKISWNTAVHYLSGMKMELIDRMFKDRRLPEVFSKLQWSRLCGKVAAVKAMQAYQDNEDLVKPHERATEEDRCSLATVSFWRNSRASATFHHLMNTMVQCCGR